MRMNADQGAQFAKLLIEDDEPLAELNLVSTCNFNTFPNEFQVITTFLLFIGR